MHSGYLLMGYLAATADLMDVEMFGTRGSWGPFHELGHNHQWAPWISRHDGSLLQPVQRLCDGDQPRLTSRATLLSSPETGPRESTPLPVVQTWSDWNVWTARDTPPTSAFGWSFYSTLFSNYRASPESEPRRVTPRIDRWVLETSRVAERDLTAFYDAWGSIGDATRSQVSVWPSWEDHPMAGRTSD